MRLIGHIERVLLQHDCVIIPGFGGFVLQSVPAIYREGEHAFSPARKEIVFNPTLTHNDGLLVESYMQEYAVDFQQAQLFVRDDVAALRDVLEAESEVEMGHVGQFTKEDTRHLFLPSNNSDNFFCTSSYGLQEFHCLPVSALKPYIKEVSVINHTEQPHQAEVRHEKQGRSSHILYQIPVTRTFVQILVASVAAVLLFLIISPPVSDVAAYYAAGFVPPEIMPKKTVDEIVNDAFSETGNAVIRENATAKQEDATVKQEDATTKQEEATAKQEEALAKQEDTPAKQEDAPTAQEEAEKTAPAPAAVSKVADASANRPPTAATVAPSSDAKPLYYVIIASFYKHQDALTHIKGLKGTEAANAKIIIADGRERVYIQSFSTEQSAKSYMDNLLQNSKQIKDAWIYKAKK